MKKVRVRFAPSPTGGLHLGGVRTALFNFLFARQHNGTFVLRVEDTDQNRFVEGAEQYIWDCLDWCGILPDEAPLAPGECGPYRQSERKGIYMQYAQQLVDSGHAYYAFDTAEEIENLRESLKAQGESDWQYGFHTRHRMRNSLTMTKEETEALLSADFPHVIRLKVEGNEMIRFKDMIRGDIEMSTNTVDDKVLMKADGMPTYHLAVVVDDYLMKITNAFRGEEWLPSAPVHVLLWKYFGWEKDMPEWAHLPLILKPDGNGKLSKRDGERLGFPVFAMQWKDTAGKAVDGFKEMGFLPEAFINMLALLGWNDGTEQEVFSLEELVQKFSMDRVHSHGAKFDFEKAKWFNHEWIKRLPSKELADRVAPFMQHAGIETGDKNTFVKIIDLVKDRCTLLPDFIKQAAFFFRAPQHLNLEAVKPKWNDDKNNFFVALIHSWQMMQEWKHDELEINFKEIAAASRLKPGELLFPLRIMLVGDKFGPGVFDIIMLIGKEETLQRVSKALQLLK
ncbi:MAG: glutamate--tRNA ligase [Bacteroidetes bacterium]|nr:glutamate--tRNA ligase [Bacteroidota bacterium]